MPVPKVRNTMLRQPRPAPNRHSATAQAFASFWSRAGAPSARDTRSTIGTWRHSGRFGGDSTSPRRLSSGPPQLMPMPARSEGGMEREASMARAVEQMRSTTGTGSLSVLRGKGLPVQDFRFPVREPAQHDRRLGAADVDTDECLHPPSQTEEECSTERRQRTASEDREAQGTAPAKPPPA